MSVRTMARVWELSQHAGSELLMLLAIGDFADDDGYAYPSVATLARKCRMKDRNARYILTTLQESGELRVQIGTGPRGTNRYRVLPDGLQRIAGVQQSAGVQPSAGTPATHCREPLQPIAAKPSENHQEPPERARSAPKRRIPADWTPPDKLKAWAEKERPDLDVGGVVERFRDHWIGQGTARASWDATFRNWVRREKAPAAGRASNGRRPSSHSGFDKLNYREGVGPNGELL
jgi:hypothetical protein